LTWFLLFDSPFDWCQTPAKTRVASMLLPRLPLLRCGTHRARARACLAGMSSVPLADDFSLRSLEEEATALVAAPSPAAVCLAVAGGGSHAISTLASTSGASSVLLEGTLAYDRAAFRAYVGATLDDVDGRGDGKKFNYTSRSAARWLSEAALARALRCAENPTRMAACIGVGCSSSLASTPSASSGDGHGSGYVVATRADGRQVAFDISLARPAAAGGVVARTRAEEDVFVSHWVYQAIECIRRRDDSETKDGDLMTATKDSISIEWGTASSEAGGHEGTVMAAARSVLTGKRPFVVLLPLYKDGKPTSFQALALSAIPDGALIFPGSFNPPHIGHGGLARAAAQKADSMSHRHDKKAVFMELSLTNVDKPSIDPETVSERVHSFLDLEVLPDRWGIVLSRAPMFSDKVSSLLPAVMTSPGKAAPELSFVIGTDTLVRLVDPKYYGNEEEAMLDALRSMEGVKFFVGGRLEQKKPPGGSPVSFVSGEEELSELPEDVREKFVILREDEFRLDLSSSEVREAKASKS